MNFLFAPRRRGKPVLDEAKVCGFGASNGRHSPAITSTIVVESVDGIGIGGEHREEGAEVAPRETERAGAGRSGTERGEAEAARQIESSDKAVCRIEAAELLILITQLEAAFSASRRPGLRNKLTATASVPPPLPLPLLSSSATPLTPPPPPSSPPSTQTLYFHQRRLSRTPASPSSIRSGITWVLIKRNASHPSTGSRPRLSVGSRGCFWHGSCPTINIIYRRLNRPAASNRHL